MHLLHSSHIKFLGTTISLGIISFSFLFEILSLLELDLLELEELELAVLTLPEAAPPPELPLSELLAVMLVVILKVTDVLFSFPAVSLT